MADPKPKTSENFPSAVGLPSADVLSKQRAKDIADAAQGAGTFKGDLVAEEQHRQNLVRQEADARAQAILDDKFWASRPEVRQQADFLAIEIQRQAPSQVGNGALGDFFNGILAAFFPKKKPTT